MKISVIIAIYDKYDYLYCVLKSLNLQKKRNIKKT